MRMLPGTDVEVSLIGKAASGFAPIFYEQPSDGRAMASVNAGNAVDLYVGGGGINGGFARALQHQNIAAYENRHKELLQSAQSGGPAHVAYEADNPTAFCLVNADRLLADQPGYLDGLCFVDVFGAAHRPHNVAENAGMIYVASPFGGNYQQEDAFLEALAALAGTIAHSARLYNGLHKPQDLPCLKVLRLCLFGAGIYNTHNTPADKIALSILQGLSTVLGAKACEIRTVELPDDEPWHAALAVLGA